MISGPVFPDSASARTRRCISGLVVQEKSVVRQVYTSWLQPQVQWICFSIAWIAASLSRAVTGGSGRPARDGSQRRPEGPVPGRESGDWAVEGRKVGRTESKPAAPNLRNDRRSHSTVPTFQHSDRKSTRLNSSHRTISYAVFC